MKKLFLLILFCLFTLGKPVNADTMPYYMNNIPTNSIGVYQADTNFKIYKSPNEKSPILLEGSFDEKSYSCPLTESNVFLIFIQKKALAFFVVTEEDEDWYQVIYDRTALKKGWIKKDDIAKFMYWRSFYNLYGTKYGLYYFKDAPDFSKKLYSDTDVNSQVISKISVSPKIKLVSVKGNFALVKVFDFDKINKIGFLQWRNQRGEIFLFPSVR